MEKPLDIHTAIMKANGVAAAANIL